MAVVLLSLTSMAMAQKVTVQGTVTDQNGETVIGAAILEKGTSNGTVTDFDGKYTLKVEKGATLVLATSDILPRNLLLIPTKLSTSL